MNRLLLSVCLASIVASPGAATPPTIAAYVLQSAPVQPGCLGGELGRRLDLTLRNNFAVLDLDQDFLRPFRQRIPKQEAKRYDKFTGIGMAILAAVNFARATDDPEAISRKNYLVEEIIKTRSPSGYIGSYVEEDGAELWTDYCFHEAAYLVYGLAEDYRHFPRQETLDAARGLADYLIAKWPQRPPGNYFTTLGLVEGFLSLYDLTKDERYLRFAADEPMGRRHRIVPAPLKSWQQELAPPRLLTEEEINAQPGRRLRYENVHIYRAICTTLTQLLLDRIEPRENLSVMAYRMLHGMTRSEKAVMLVTGAIGSKEEAWNENQVGDGKVAETCANVYELWFFDELLRRESNLSYGDLMERVMYNAVFGAQDPTGRHICYFTPFSGKREFFERDSYCCPNNFRRGIAALPDFVYYRSDDGVAINLYNESRLETTLGSGTDLRISQTTAYPSSGQVSIHVTPTAPARFALALRIPRWCANPEVRINGTAATGAVAQGAWTITREWRAGDIVELNLPMKPRWVQGRQSQAGRAALLCGPVLYGLNPSLNPNVSGFTLRDITIDPASIGDPVADDHMRPGGIGFRVKAWSPGHEQSEAPDLDLLLTEFADTGAEEVYFRLSSPELAVIDELLEQSVSPAATGAQ